MTAFSRFSPQARGILFMLGAIFLFSVMDAMAKALSQRVDTVMVLWARYLGQTLVVFVLVLPRLGAVVRTNYPGLQFLRSVALLGATSCFFYGVSVLGLAETTALMDINPVLVTLGAALVLGERFGPRRALGVAASLVGALIIIRPGLAVFSPHALLPLAAACCYASYALITRFVGKGEDVRTSLLYTALVGAVLLTLAVPFFWTRPDAVAASLMLVIGGVGATGQLLLIRAFTEAEASLVAPFAYAGLIFATIWGMLIFGDYPDAATLVGAVVIVGSGLYVWHRETRGPEAAAARPSPAGGA